MTRNRLPLAILALGLVLTPVVIGRYGAAFAGFLHLEVLVGLAAVATLVALITLEYQDGATRLTRPVNSVRQSATQVGQPSAIVPVYTRDDRAAA